MIGKFLEQYYLKTRLGRGSFGELYEAEVLGSDEMVALKLIDSSLMRRPEFRSGLNDLVATVSRLNQPDILPYQRESSDDHTFLVMPYLPDGSLQVYLQKLRLAGKELDAQTAVRLVIHILTLLRHQVVLFAGLSHHGGLHPRNILLRFTTRDEEPAPVRLILTDFGQADLVRRTAAQSDLPYRGIAPYTPQLPSSEEQPPPTDARADLYALGHLLYYLVHGNHIRQEKGKKDKKNNDQVNPLFEGLASGKAGTEWNDFVRGATYIALTAMRIYDFGPGDRDRIWYWWQAALEQLLAGDFTIPEPSPLPETTDETEAESNREIDALWRGEDQPPLTWSDQPPLLRLPLPEPVAESAQNGTTAPPETERPSIPPITIYVTWTADGEPPLNLPHLYTTQPDQGLITIGSDSAQDITLRHDKSIRPHHLDIRHQGEHWLLLNRTNTSVHLGQRRLEVDEPTPWLAGQPLRLGRYTLQLQPETGIDRTQDISVTLLPTIQEIRPGTKARVGIDIRNERRSGARRDYFVVKVKALTVDGLPDDVDWLTLRQDGLVLKPGERRTLTLEVAPGLKLPNQDVPYLVSVQRMGHDGHVAQERGIVRITATADFQTALITHKGDNQGRYQLIVQNNSNQRLDFLVSSEDPLRALRFAYVSERAEEIEAESPSRPGKTPAASRLSTPPAMSNIARQQMRNIAPLRYAQQIRSRLQRWQYLAGWWSRSSGVEIPKSRLTFPRVPRRQLAFSETLTHKLSIPARSQASLFLVVKPRRRSTRWRPQQLYPFAIIITPQNSLEAARQPRTETAVLEVTSHLSRGAWVLLAGFLLLLCLLGSGYAVSAGNERLNEIRQPQATAIADSYADPDSDGISSYDELMLYGTDPHSADTDSDGLKDGEELALRAQGICPTSKDCDGDGVPDWIEVRRPTPTPTAPGGFPYPTALPTLTPTPIPTLTPEATAASQVGFSKFDSRVEDISEPIAIGDTAENVPLTATFYFSLRSLPPNASISNAQLALFIINETELAKLQEQLGRIYITIGNTPLQQSLAAASMFVLPEDDKVLMAQLPAAQLAAGEEITLHLFFELASNGDDGEDLLDIWMPQAEEMGQLPMLQIEYAVMPTEDK